jgi:RNA polymerase sigma-70 factor, ECF subfamily
VPAASIPPATPWPGRSAWAIGLGIWEIRTVRRRHWRRRETPGEGEMRDRPLDTASPEELAIAADLAAELGQTLATLRPPDLEALLRYAHDERPAGAGFRKRLQRARERMRAAWRSRHG